MSAAECGNVEALGYLLEAGCDANQKGIDGSTALHAAVAKKHVDCVRTLIANDADPSQRNNVFVSPLMMAVDSGNIDILRAMVEVNKDAKDHKDIEGQTLLHVACKKGLVDIVRLLLDLGCDANVTDINFHTPLIAAVLHHHLGVVQCLVEKCNIDFPGQRKATALIYAAQTNELKCVKMLLSAGASVNEQDIMGNTALIAGGPYCTVINMLLNSGANPNVQNHFGMTALWYAAYYHYVDAVEILLRANSDPELKGAIEDEFHTSALEIALKRGHFSISKLIIYAGCSLARLTNFIQTSNVLQSFHSSETGQEFLDWTKRWTKQPRSLAYLSRRSIRQSFGSTNVSKKVKGLPMPESLLKYISLSTLTEEVEGTSEQPINA